MADIRKESFGRIAFRGGLVTGAAQILRIVIQFLSVIILARLLVPEDFGLVASVSPIAAFIGLFQNLGLQQAVIQRKDISEAQLNQVFWMSTFVGIACTVVLCFAAPVAAAFYGDARMTSLTIATALPLLLGSLAALPLALMNRRLQYAQLAINDIISAAAGFLATIIAAYMGLGYWSLALSGPTTAILTLVLAWWTTGWLPDKPVLKVDRDIISFGANLTGFNVVNFFARNLDNILIGKYSGPVELGYYDRAYKLLLFPLRNLTEPLSRVMVPLLSKVQDNKLRFREIYLQTNWLLAIVTVPGITACAMASQQLVDILFGTEWAAVAPIFAWLGIAGIIQPVNSTTGWIFICQGKTNVMFRWGIYSSATTVCSFLAGLHWGAVGVAAAYAIVTIVCQIPVMAVVLQRVGPVKAKDYLLLQGVFLVAAASAWSLHEFLVRNLAITNQIVIIALAILLSYSIALAAVMAFPVSRSSLLCSVRRIAGLKAGEQTA